MNVNSNFMEQALLLEHMDRAASDASAKAPGPVSDRRVEPRWRYRRYGIAIEVQQPGVEITRFLVVTRNLARGLGFLHSDFLAPKSICTITLLRPDGLSHVVTGRITSCRAIEGNTHEVGVKFRQRVEEGILMALLPAPESLLLSQNGR